MFIIRSGLLWDWNLLMLMSYRDRNLNFAHLKQFYICLCWKYQQHLMTFQNAKFVMKFPKENILLIKNDRLKRSQCVFVFILNTLWILTFSLFLGRQQVPSLYIIFKVVGQEKKRSIFSLMYEWYILLLTGRNVNSCAYDCHNEI